MTGRIFHSITNVLKKHQLKNSCLWKTLCLRNIGTSKETEAVMLKEFGDPRKVLSLEKIPVQHPSDDEVFVKMLMAPINPSDINMIEGTYHIRPKLPSIVGNEGVGEVVEIGKNVKNMKAGDWVIPAEPAWGTWRQLAVTKENLLLKIDNDIPLLSAATIMVNPCTAYRMLKDYVMLEAGDLVIQNGANSAVGQCVIQLAKEWGIKTINIVRDRPDLESLKSHLNRLGATHVVTEEFVRTSEMKELINSYNQKPKLALNCVGGKSATELIRFLKEKGTIVTYGGMSKKPLTIPTGALIFKEVKIMGYWNTQWNFEHRDSDEKKDMYKNLCDLIRDCKLLPSPSELVPFSNFQEAVDKSLEGFQNQKKVLVMQE
ncbi:enoyl-[acyl-carrier-protein] reductase, mitochondrial-like [Mytilus californianus]|uniref:enoyl-[acyl-carrier-protein] reductase, mitochondrial-like n=1 Tax=Mytilus californianus TaxID=6549 RepID=UPI0022466293|nr:enoyl-[acyl-carrier-protein] reductase, mitochondrial-like [Mytilus californianus]